MTAAPMTFCTAISRNYVAVARVLAESLARHEPDSRLTVLVVDGGDDPAWLGPLPHPGARLVSPAMLGLEPRELHRIATSSSAQMLVSRLKPLLVRELLGTGLPVTLVDADTCAYAPLDELRELLAREPLVVRPHLSTPSGLGPRSRLAMGPLIWGIHNGGFLGAGPGAEAFADWWWERTRVLIVPDPGHPLSFCQTWLDHAGPMFGAHSAADADFNVTVFDLADRDIEWAGDQPLLGSRRLAHFHFLGSIDPLQPDAFSVNPEQAADYPDPAERPGAASLYREYLGRVRDAGYEERSEPLFDRAPDERPIAAADRKLYREALFSHETAGTDEPPNPFDEGPDAFFGWLEWIRARSGGTASSA